MIIRINKWASYQSYKDRTPPWIRFHKTFLDNYEYHSMNADARALLPMLWLLASEDDDPRSGLIKQSIKKISFRLRLSEKLVANSIKEIEAAGFIQCDSGCNESVTNPLQDRNQSVTPETETETETDKVATLPDFIDKDLWKDFLATRKQLKAVNSQRAINTILNKLTAFKKKGYNPNKIIETSITGSWKDVYEPKGDIQKKSGVKVI